MNTAALKKNVICTVGALVAAIAFTTAAAGSAQADELRQRAVSFADLNLSAPAGCAIEGALSTARA